MSHPNAHIAVEAARYLWSLDIQDPPRSTWKDSQWDVDRRVIDDIIRSPMGLGWARCSATVRAYRHDGDYEWCGGFAAWCWRHAGLAPRVAKLYWASTYRLSRWGQRKLAFWTPNEFKVRKDFPGNDRKFLLITPKTTLEDVLAWGPEAGDVLTVDTVGGWTYGHHVTLLNEPITSSVAPTFEGNASGNGPIPGQRFQGIVERERPFSTWRCLYRPGVTDTPDTTKVPFIPYAR